MPETYDVLTPDGSVVQYHADQFAEIAEARSRAQHDEMIADGWLALDQRIEIGDEPKPPSALKEAFAERVVPPGAAPEITVYILGRLKPGEKGERVV